MQKTSKNLHYHGIVARIHLKSVILTTTPKNSYPWTQIFDSLAKDYNKTFPPQVKPSYSLDLCVSSPEQVANKLKSFVVMEGNKLDGFLNKGELSQAVQLGISVIKSTNEKSECGKELDPQDKALVREKELLNCNMQDLNMFTVISFSLSVLLHNFIAISIYLEW